MRTLVQIITNCFMSHRSSSKRALHAPKGAKPFKKLKKRLENADTPQEEDFDFDVAPQTPITPQKMVKKVVYQEECSQQEEPIEVQEQEQAQEQEVVEEIPIKPKKRVAPKDQSLILDFHKPTL